MDYLAPGVNWANTVKAFHEDEFALDATRLTLVCGTAGFDGTQFKNMLAAEYDIQLNKTSRNSVLLQTNINNTRSDIAHLIKVLVGISQKIEEEACSRKRQRCLRRARAIPDARCAQPAELQLLPFSIPRERQEPHE